MVLISFFLLVNRMTVKTEPLILNKPKLAEMYNLAFSKCRGEIIMYSADDVHFKTKNWDILIAEEFNRY